MGNLKSEEQYITEMATMLQEKLQKDYPIGHTRRDAHPKALGLLKGELKIESNLPKELQKGIFSTVKTYPVLIRISNSSAKVQSDTVKDVRGFAMKVLGVEGEKYLGDEKSTQDFLLISYPTIPLGTVPLFHKAIYYATHKNPIALALYFICTGKGRIVRELFKSRQHHSSPLDIQYWSTTPYALEEIVVKYSIIPTSKYHSVMPNPRTDNYLTENMEKHLSTTEATFDFMIQVQRNPKTMPVEDSSVEWKESESPFIKVAQLRIPVQKINTDRRWKLAEILSFSPGHSLLVHRPIGGLNRARVRIYSQLSQFRHERDGKPLFEPKVEDFHNVE